MARTQNHNGHVFCLSLSCLASSCSLTRARNRSVLRPRAPQGPFSCCDGTRATRDEMICERRNEREETETSDMCAQTIYYFKTQSPFDSSSSLVSLSKKRRLVFYKYEYNRIHSSLCSREAHTSHEGGHDTRPSLCSLKLPLLSSRLSSPFFSPLSSLVPL